MNNETNDFLRRVIASGKVLPLNEAFKKHPVEDEEHKGDSNYYVAEDSEKYFI